jgi:hypothetical protein
LVAYQFSIVLLKGAKQVLDALRLTASKIPFRQGCTFQTVRWARVKIPG